MDASQHPATERIIRSHDAAEAFELVSRTLSGADHTAFLMDDVRARAGHATARDVLQQFERDRFVRPSTADALTLLSAELAALTCVSSDFEPIVLAPLVPFATHSAVAGVDQNRVVTTIRGSEVAADPTTALALEAAVRRRRLAIDPAGRSEVVRLSGAQRVTRAQRFDGPLSFAHFSLLGLVSAGRDTGNLSFESAALVEHARAQINIVRELGAGALSVRLTDFGGRGASVIEYVIDELSGPTVDVRRWDERPDASSYYPGLCFKVVVNVGGEDVEVGDGGFVDWTQTLVGSAKERLMTSGLSLERLAVAGIS